MKSLNGVAVSLMTYLLMGHAVGVTMPAIASLTSDFDLSNNGMVDGADIGVLLLQWGTVGSADFNQDGDVDGSDLGQLLLRWGETYAPSIHDLTPASVLIGGGAEVMIHGAKLAGAYSVTLSGIEAQIVSADATSVVILTPATPYGYADLVVYTLGGVASTADALFFDHLPVPWGEVIAVTPDPSIVTDSSARAAIESTGYPWKVRHSASQVDLVLIPPGEFTMGATSDTSCFEWYDSPQHQVVLTQPFYLGQTEVTYAQWFFGGSPEQPQCDTSNQQRPATCIDLYSITSWLSVRGLRLPSEAEWEYACRAGTTADVYGPVSEIAVTAQGTSTVATRLPNPFGLYDMIGNAYEWVADGEYVYSSSPQVDPFFPGNPNWRIHRGGGGGSCLSAAHRRFNASCCGMTRHPVFGFRAARSVD